MMFVASGDKELCKLEVTHWRLLFGMLVTLSHDSPMMMNLGSA